jgi:drug/metabolite transporter (DMT)-like permease
MDSRLRWKTPTFAAIVIFNNVLGNLLLKWGMDHSSAITASPLSYLRAIFNPWASLGICLLIVWMLSKMFLLSWADLSYVLPVTAFGYVINAALGRLFLGEHVTAARWAGTLFIMAGVILVGLGNPHSKEPL